ncbi:MAG: pirin family protein [Alphaproteobacteria bacterium]
MITLYDRMSRGHTRTGWLDSRHTFSFGHYFDPARTGFGSLRVINEDRVIPGAGFPTHSHNDMEILTYVLAGALQHKDSLGNGSVIRPGDVQRMSAGTGISHSEFNPSRQDPVHFLQIWLFPARNGLEPSYEQRHFPQAEKGNRFRLIIDPDGDDGAITIHQDARVYACCLNEGHTVENVIAPGRSAWLQLARGSATLNGNPMKESDGAALTDEAMVRVAAEADSEMLLFDLG